MEQVLTSKQVYQISLPQPFLMASVLTGYPDSRFAEFLDKLMDDPETDKASSIELPDQWLVVKNQFSSICSSLESIDAIRSEYIDLFERGAKENSLHETEIGRDVAIIKGSRLSDIAGFYRAFGMNMADQPEHKEMLDHVSVELEFYSVLLMKQEYLAAQEDAVGSEIVLDARRKFLREHLAKFLPLLAERPSVLASRFYGPVFVWARTLILDECRRLDITPLPLEWVRISPDAEPVCCGGEGTALQ